LAAFGFALSLLAGCASPSQRYLLVERYLQAGDPKAADAIIEGAHKEYGSKSRLLYLMDRGMTQHLSEQYQPSNATLEQADDEVERLYTRSIRTETKAFLLNDTELPFEGEPFEQVMINVVKALNYAVLGQWNEALVEARRIDHRLNVLSDQADSKSSYKDDGFARYLSGILYEVTGDLNNAFVAYRRADDAYTQTRSWMRTPTPNELRRDLLRITDALHLTSEHQEYRQTFSDLAWQSPGDLRQLAQVVLISYNGRSPRKEDVFIDLPISLEALNLVLLTKQFDRGNHQDQEARTADSLLYGLSGRVVRVALPRLIPQRSQVQFGEIALTSPTGGSYQGRTEVAHNLTSAAERRLEERLPAISVKAAARAAVKFAMAEGVGRGAQAAAGRDSSPLIGILAGGIAHALAIGTEEADKRSWRTLPDEIQIARLWVEPGDYELRYRPVSKLGGTAGRDVTRKLSVKAGETKFLTERIVY
jgi:hypothetical protein